MANNTTTPTIEQKLDRIESLALLAAKNVLTLEEASLLLGVSKSHLYKLTSAREVPHYKPSGKTVYFDRQELEDWMKRGRVASKDEAAELAAAYIRKRGGKR